MQELGVRRSKPNTGEVKPKVKSDVKGEGAEEECPAQLQLGGQPIV